MFILHLCKLDDEVRVGQFRELVTFTLKRQNSLLTEARVNLNRTVFLYFYYSVAIMLDFINNIVEVLYRSNVKLLQGAV